jgi:calcineurin-like phosphoesterase
MRVLYVAEIVGKAGIHCVKTLVPKLREEHRIDLVIANGDGTTGGYGLGKNHSMYLRKLGIDVITGGDQMFFKKDLVDHIDSAYHLLRPANLPPEMPGRGWRHYTVRPRDWESLMEVGEPGDSAEDQAEDSADANTTAGANTTANANTTDRGASDSEEKQLPGVQVAVVSLLGQSGYDRIHGANPYHWLNHTLERLRKKAVAVIIDFHALTTAEKQTMFHFADGMVTAIFGSGQRVQTADAQVLPSGTAVICDAGRTGSTGGVHGFKAEPEIKGFMTALPIRSEESWDQLELQGALLDIDTASGYVTSFSALRVPCEPPKNLSVAGSTTKPAAAATAGQSRSATGSTQKKG